MHAVTGSQFANIRNIAVHVHMIHVKSNTHYEFTEIKKYIATHFDAAVNVYNIMEVMVCKKSAYLNCSGRLITVPEDL